MSGFTEYSLTLLLLFTAGAIAGGLISYRLLHRHFRNNDVRWQRRLREARHELDKELARTGQTLVVAEQKNQDLRNALNESEETVRLLSAKNVPAYEIEIQQRNERLAELEKKMASLRAELADVADQEQTDRIEIDRLQEELATRDAHIDELLTRNAEFSGLKKLNSDQEDRFASMQAELEAAEQRKIQSDEHYRARLEQQTRALEDARADLQRQLVRLAEYENNAPDYQAELAARDARLTELSRQFENLQHKLPTLNDALREREASIEDLIAELSKQRRNNKRLQQELETSTRPVRARISGGTSGANVVDLQPRLRTDAVARSLAQSSQQPDEAASQIARLEAELENWKRRATGDKQDHITSGLPAVKAWQRDNPGSTEKRDNLKKIRGIGPVLENTLNDLGIVCFDQLMRLNKDDIEALKRHDSSLPHRLQRDNWIEQAKDLRNETSD